MSIAVAVVIWKKKLLLIERGKGNYKGLLGLPGGKVEKNEHVSTAAVRELREESGIHASFRAHLGVVSELLVENGATLQHFILHVCELHPLSTDITTDAEGVLNWYDLDLLVSMKDKIIPSDFVIIERLVRRKEKEYFDCTLEKVGDEYILRKFE